MSCALQAHSLIPDLDELKAILYPGALKNEELQTNYDYDNRWAWDDDMDTTDPSNGRNGSLPRTQAPAINSWLGDCFQAISPADGEVQAFARDRYLAVYKTKQSANDSPAKRTEKTMQIVASTSLAGLTGDEKISALALVPLVSQQKSNEGAVDWTAVVLGFTSGVIRIYTENGQFVFYQKFSEEPVKCIKCSTFYSPITSGKKVLPDEPEQPDEIMVALKSEICVIEGFAFYQTIRSARNHLARVPSGHDAIRHAMEIGITLAFKKWQFTRDAPAAVSDIDSGGIHSTSTYDMFVGQSVRGDVGGTRKNKLLAKRLVTVGDSPFLGFYAAHEDESQATLTEVAQAVVSTMKSFIPRFGSKRNDDQTKTEQIALPIKPRLGFYDQNRDGLKLFFSPDKSFAAVSDEFGRVTLVDVRHSLGLRMWKGYRDAECGWIATAEDSSTSTSKTSLLLVIYAPKRGIVEIWRCLKGPRIAAFNVGKNCRLLYNNYGMLGFNHLMKLGVSVQLPACFLFDRVSGKTNVFDIPFVCSLTDKSSKVVRDNHLLKEFKTLLDADEVPSALTVLLNVHSPDVLKDALNYSIATKDVTVIVKASYSLQQYLLHHSPASKSEALLDYSTKLLVQHCSRVLQLCHLYQEIVKLSRSRERLSPCDFLKDPPRDIESLAKSLSWKAADVAKCISLFGLRHSVLTAGTTYHSNQLDVPHIKDFLANFCLEQNQIFKDPKGHFVTDDIPVDVKWDCSKGDIEHFYSLANFLFEPIFCEDVTYVFKLYDSCVIKPSSLLRLLYLMWLSPNGQAEHWRNWASFSFAVKTISTQLNESTDEDCLLSSSWKSICSLTVASRNLPAALVGGFVTKAITSELTFQKSATRDDEESDNMWDDEWETLSLDEERLNLLLRQLEDTFLLDLLLKSDKNQETDSGLSLSYLLKSNSGIVSEHIAKWAVRSRIPPTSLLALCENANFGDGEMSDGDDIGVADEASRFTYSLLDEETVKELLGHVRSCFPQSLEPQVLLANCSLDALAHWDKNPSLGNVSLLRQSISYLNAISSAVLKHNIGCLLWKSFVVKKFETLCILMEKMGKVPKERICQKDLGMSDNCLEEFVQYAHDLLEIIVQHVSAAKFEGLPLFAVDEWWRNRPVANNQRPLVLLAESLKTSNNALVLEHTHLALVVLFMITFQMKSYKPLSLFPSYVRQSMFKELHSTNFDSPLGDHALNDLRINFLLSIAASIAQSVPNADSSNEFGPSLSKLHSVAVKWFSNAIVMTREWELSVDTVRRRFVCELYKSACDSLATEINNSLFDRSALSAELLPIAAQRVLHLITQDVLPSNCALPPNVAMWLQSLEPDGQICSASKESTLLLLQLLLNDLEDDSPPFKITCALIEVLKA